MIQLHSRITLIRVLGTLVIRMLDNLKLGMDPWCRGVSVTNMPIFYAIMHSLPVVSNVEHLSRWIDQGEKNQLHLGIFHFYHMPEISVMLVFFKKKNQMSTLK